MPRKDSLPTTEALHGWLRGAGLRVTGPRMAVLRQLCVSETPASHADVADRLAADGFDRATVYRNLMDLAQAGLARRSDMGDHVWRFELLATRKTPEAAHAKADHPHFVCDECGDVTCLPGTTVTIEAARNTPRALRKNSVQVHVRGRCDRCAT